ncbi:MAG: hypothetical protein HZA51_14320 [Planctomycetes bacterium]|nr:hypothetical protein [Planctomycetota bacterium]
MKRAWFSTRKKLVAATAALAMGHAFDSGCLSSEIALRFREAYAPGLTAGATAAITDPQNAEDGLRQAWAALYDGIGAIITPRSADSSGSRR